MKILVFDTDTATRNLFDAELTGHMLVYIDGPVSREALTAHSGAEVVSMFASSSLFQKEHIGLMPKLKCIVTRSTGFDNVDLAAAQEKGIVVCNVPRYGSHTVAEFAFALILTLSRRMWSACSLVRESGKFKKDASLEGFDLYGKILGVVGTGAIGRSVVGIAKAFGMQVLMFDIFPNAALADESARYVSMDELLAQSDIITVHTPSTKENHHLLNEVAFSKMKKGVFIINTARGELVDTAALVHALQNGIVAGAGLDVLEDERKLKDGIEGATGIESIDALKVLMRDYVHVDAPRVIITPHVAFFSREAYHEILRTSLENIRSFIAGTPINVVQ